MVEGNFAVDHSKSWIMNIIPNMTINKEQSPRNESLSPRKTNPKSPFQTRPVNLNNKMKSRSDANSPRFITIRPIVFTKDRIYI